MEKRTRVLIEALDTLEAERLVETVKLRYELVKECKALLPAAIRQAKPKRGRKNKDGTRSPARPGNAGLLRLIARVAMRDVRLDKSPKH